MSDDGTDNANTSADGSVVDGSQVADGQQGASSDAATGTELLIGPDGSFQEGWKEKYIPEDLRTDKVFDATPNVGEMAKMLGNVQRMIGKKGLVVPGENATPSEIDAFHRALGRPDKPEDYKIEKPTEIPDDFWDANIAAGAQKLFHELGLNPQQAAKLMAFDNQRLIEGIKALDAEKKQEHEDAVTALKERWGDNFEERQHIANKLVADNVTDEEEKAAIIKIVGNNPYVCDMLATIGEKFEEHALVSGGAAGGSAGMTPAQAQARMDELAATPDFASGKLHYSNPGAYKRVVDEMAALAKIVAKAKAG